MHLRDIDIDDRKLVRINGDEIIGRICSRSLYKIKSEETNGIYVYLGTYKYTDEIDIVHSPSDIRVNDDDVNADYRRYQDLENYSSIEISISKSKEFEDSHIVINPKTFNKSRVYYDIQRDFFVSAVKNSQESAKKKILRKYPRLNRKS